MSQAKMRCMFIVLEQQRASRDAMENLGAPNESRMQARIRAKILSSPEEKRAGRSDE
jgi:hypothetical protein